MGHWMVLLNGLDSAFQDYINILKKSLIWKKKLHNQKIGIDKRIENSYLYKEFLKFD
jgi:hypothetical protein